MAETQHTPGPWAYDDEDGTISAHGGVVAETSHSDYTLKQDARNAGLIAAAPDMLEALRDLTAAYRSARVALGYDEDGESDSLELAEAAIAKAEGRS